MQRWIRQIALAMIVTLFTTMAMAQNYTPDQVEATAKSGDWDKAEQMTRSIIQQHPNDAKPHYFLAKILAHDKQYAAALTEANKAEDMDDAKYHQSKGSPVHFTKNPAEFFALQAKLIEANAPAKTVTTTTTTSKIHALAAPVAVVRAAPVATVVHSSDPSPFFVLGLIVLLAVAALLIAGIIWLIMRMFKKPEPEVVVQERVVHVHDAAPVTERPYRPMGYGSVPPPAAPPVAPPVQRAYTGSPAMAVATSASPVAQQQGHSTGAVIGAGVGGLAAGMLLDEMLHHDRGQGYGQGGFVGGGGRFGGAGSSEEIDTQTTTTTTYDDGGREEAREELSQTTIDDSDVGDNNWSDNNTSSNDDNFSTSDDGGDWS